MTKKRLLSMTVVTGFIIGVGLSAALASKDPNAILHQGASDVGVAPTGYPMYIAGIDSNGNLQGLKVNSSGQLVIGQGGNNLGHVTDDPPGATNTNQTATSSSSTGAASAITATLAAAASKYTYITGFQVTGAGATGASVITVTVTGTAGGTMNYNLAIPAGTTAGVQPLIVQFAPPLQSSAQNTAIVVNVPSFGTGNTNEAVSAQGFQQ